MGTVQLAQISLTWIDDGTTTGMFAYEGDIDTQVDPPAITITEDIGVIVVTLSPESTEGATLYSEQPVLWVDPESQPRDIALATTKGGKLVIADVDIDTNVYSFSFQVEYKGVVYTSPDPSIVNTGTGGFPTNQLGGQVVSADQQAA